MTKKSILCFSFFIFFSSTVFPENSYLKVRIINGTTKKVGRADLFKVILLKDGMMPLKEIQNVQGSFQISDLEIPEGVPLLLQANYKGATYNKMVPPVLELRKNEILIEVFETTSNPSILRTRSLVQFVKLPDILQVYKIYIIQNTSEPPVTYVAREGLDFFIPEGHSDLTGVWTQGSSGMGIPIQFETRTKTIKTIQRPVLPGDTEIQIQYTLPWKSREIVVEDQLLFERSTSSNRPVFIRPKDMDLTTMNSESLVELQDDIPDGLRGYMVVYSKANASVKFILSGGTPISVRSGNQPREIVNGLLFPDWHTSLAGVIAILSFLFILKYLSEFILKKRYSNGK